MRNLTVIAVIAVAILILLANTLFIVPQTAQAIVIQFGDPVRVVQEPGLKAKMPFVQNVLFFDKRLLGLTVEQKEVLSSDQKRFVVDAFVRYRITDPLQYFRTNRDESTTQNLISTVVDSNMRQVLGQVPLSAVLSPERTNIMKAITELVNSQTTGVPLTAPIKLELNEAPLPAEPENKEAQAEPGSAPEAPAVDETRDETVQKPANGEPTVAEIAPVAETAVPKGGFGVEVVDVRIMRADLPQENSQAVFKRMQTEREREAKDLRAKGEEEAQRIRSRADRDRTVILATAQQEANTIRGEGEAEATRIFAEAFSRDPEFYNFYRTMQAYRNSLKADDTTVILTPDSDFLRYFE